MSKTKPTNVAMDRVKSYVDRLEKMEEERKAIGGDIRDIYLEAKGNGFDVKTLRWLLSERKVDAAERDERDALRAVYANALGMAVDLVEVNGLSLRQASKRTGIPKSNIHRALAVPKVSQPAPSHDPETGEITTAGLDTPPVGSSELSEGHSSAAPDSDADVARFAPHLDEPRETATQQETTHEREGSAGADEGPRGHDAADRDRPVGLVASDGRADEGEAGEERHSDGRCDAGRGDKAGEQVTAGAVAEAQPERVARQDDGLDIPPFLRRQRASA